MSQAEPLALEVAELAVQLGRADSRSLREQIARGSRVAAFRREPRPGPHIPQEWTRQASCIGLDPEMFFDQRAAEAVAVCTGCPVRAECAALGLSAQEGVWAGENHSTAYCIRGHELDADNTMREKRGNGSVQVRCLQCKREARRQSAARARNKTRQHR